MKRRKPRNQATHAKELPGRFRIIGGACRGRRLSIPASHNLRPTPDRVRETLFNWLAPVIEGARCLDLYAGSGALGLEALSRGAAHVTFVDREPAVVRAIDEHLQRLGLDGGETRCADAAAFLKVAPTPCDVVFLDPPYGSVALDEVCSELAARGWLAPGARVYLEDEAGSGEPQLPAGWRLLRSARAGNVGYHLAAGPPGSGRDQRLETDQSR